MGSNFFIYCLFYGCMHLFLDVLRLSPFPPHPPLSLGLIRPSRPPSILVSIVYSVDVPRGYINEPRSSLYLFLDVLWLSEVRQRRHCQAREVDTSRFWHVR